MVKVKITTTLDLDIKEAFESTAGIHQKGYGEVLEKAIRELLVELNQTPYIDMEIAKTEQETLKLSTKTQNLKLMKERISKINPVSKNNGDGDKAKELESYRNKRFLEVYATKEKLDLLKINLKKGNVNWERVIELYKFKDKDEARTWMENKVLGSEV
jgi:hypothetical protein